MPVHYQGIPSQYPPGAAARHPHSAPTGPTQFSQPPLGSHYAGQPGILAGSLESPASGVSRSYSRSMLSAEEKELRRKVSHSAIEKRRRERTNAVLRDLQDMVPGIPKFGKIQKLEILEGAAEYIRQLRVSVDQQQQQVFTPGAQPWQQQSKQPGGCNGHCTNTHPTSHARQCERDLSCSHSVDTQAPDSSLPRVQSPLQVNHLRPTAAHIGSPTSVSSGMSRDGSGDDTLANPADSPASPHPPASSDDDSMKVKFLIA
ncbi:hypothetical protein GGF46_000765 [Coemansia sp. RSA 552]|nr:hypothetical protein GGF46_000765 [Coemansia sp. RSA 552]